MLDGVVDRIGESLGLGVRTAASRLRYEIAGGVAGGGTYVDVYVLHVVGIVIEYKTIYTDVIAALTDIGIGKHEGIAHRQQVCTRTFYRTAHTKGARLKRRRKKER